MKRINNKQREDLKVNTYIKNRWNNGKKYMSNTFQIISKLWNRFKRKNQKWLIIIKYDWKELKR